VVPDDEREGTALLMADMIESRVPEAEVRIDIEQTPSYRLSSVRVLLGGRSVDLIPVVYRVVNEPRAHYLPTEFVRALQELDPDIDGSIVDTGEGDLPYVDERIELNRRTQFPKSR
jgi:hypothetical protein